MKAFLPCLSLLLLPFGAFPTQAQDADYPCYWQTSQGRIVNLATLCNDRPTQAARSADAAFLDDFQRMAGRYSGETGQVLNRYLNQQRDGAIAEAKTTCRVLQSGGWEAESTRREALAARDSSEAGNIRRQITRTLAVVHYCPQFAVR